MKFIRRKRKLLMHLLMAFVGGGTGIYAIMLRGNFGQAQTANLLDLVIHVVLGDDWAQVLQRFGAFAFFLSALAITHFLKRVIQEEILEVICFGVEVIGLLVAGFVPVHAPDMMALWPVFFLTGFQWGVFAGADGFNCSTIFCSNNCKQALFGWMDYAMDHQRRSFEQGRFYTATICFFYGGAAVTGVLTTQVRNRSVMFLIVPISLAFLVWVLSGSAVRAEKETFTEGAHNYRKGTSEL